MLAQLLIQFQKPIITENTALNTTNNVTNVTVATPLNNFSVERSIRSLSLSDESINTEEESRAIKERFVASDFPPNGMKDFY